jgi:hypothetical protein
MKPRLNRVTQCFAFSLALGMAGGAFAASPNTKCGTGMTLNFAPGTTVPAGTLVTVTEEINVTTQGSGTQDCAPLVPGNYVNGGNAKIQAVKIGEFGPPAACADVGKKYCTAGDPALSGTSCTANSDCDGSFGGGICTAAALFPVASENPTDGLLAYGFDTTGLGGKVAGFRAQYEGGGNFQNAPFICQDVTVNEVESCSGATIGIDLADGPGSPAAGGTYGWMFQVTVHACEKLFGVTAQGGTNGWAQLVDRSKNSLHPDTGTADIRNPNKKADVILWTIGDMEKGQTAKLLVELSGSIPPKTPDCQVRYLSGPWSALFSIDDILFQKSDYTGRVLVQVDSNGNPNDCP